MSKLKYFDGTTWKVVNGQVTGDTLPIGSIMPYGSSTAPTNWLVCDGSAVSRTDYSELFAVIGTSYGAGDGSTTFNLPDLRGRVAVGRKSTDTSFDTMGETGGEKSVTLTSQELPTLQAKAPSSTSGGSIVYFNNSAVGGTTGSGTGNAIATINGGGQAHNNLQPYQVVCYIIKSNQSAGLVGQVVNQNSNSTTNTYSCDYENKHFGGVVLYNNPSGTASSISNLSENVENFSYVEIYFKTNDSGSSNSTKIISSPSGTKVASLFYIWHVGGTNYVKVATVNVSSKTISFKSNTQFVDFSSKSDGDYVFITKVVGYK